MKKMLWITIVALALITSPLAAGEKKHHSEKCDGNPADCAAKLQKKIANKAWIGIEMDMTDDNHYQITRVLPGSPAEAAGLHKGDILLAMNGEAYTKDNKKGLQKAWNEVSPGSHAVLKIARDGHKKKVKISLGHVPKNLMAQWVGEHMLGSHVDNPVKVAKK